MGSSRQASRVTLKLRTSELAVRILDCCNYFFEDMNDKREQGEGM